MPVLVLALLISLTASAILAADQGSMISHLADSLAAPPSVNSLAAPASPAFVLLGATPTSIAKPSTPSDLALTLMNTTSDLTEIPTSISLEVSPYWLSPRPKLSWRSDTTRGIWESVTRTLSVSLATARFGDSTNPTTGLALGVRTALVSGRMSTAEVNRMKKLEDSLSNRVQILLKAQVRQKSSAGMSYLDLQALLDTVKNDTVLNNLPEDTTVLWTEMLQVCDSLIRAQESSIDRQELEDRLRAIQTALGPSAYSPRANKLVILVQHFGDSMSDEQFAALAESVHANLALSPTDSTALVRQKNDSLKDFESERVGFKWEVAGGLIWDFPDRIAKHGKLRGGGVWSTFSYVGTPLANGEGLACIRYIKNELLTPTDEVLDLGLRALYRFNIFSVSYEYVRRVPQANFHSDGQLWRQALLFEVNVAPGKQLSLTVGEDFDRDAANSFLAQVAFNLGLRRLGLVD